MHYHKCVDPCGILVGFPRALSQLHCIPRAFNDLFVVVVSIIDFISSCPCLLTSYRVGGLHI